jgi:hypothetical protein
MFPPALAVFLFCFGGVDWVGGWIQYFGACNFVSPFLSLLPPAHCTPGWVWKGSSHESIFTKSRELYLLDVVRLSLLYVLSLAEPTSTILHSHAHV